MDRWTEIEVFSRIAELGSISKAAETLGMSVSSASRHLIALEERLSARLVHRSTRRLSLTTEGEVFHGRARELLLGMAEAEASVSDLAVNPTGLLRVSASLSFSLLHLNPITRDFLNLYPNVRFEIMASNRYYDIIENGVDVAIRTRHVEADSSITVRRLAETRRILTASPEYLSQRGKPAHPSDLTEHDVLLYTLSDSWDVLKFRREGEEVTVPLSGIVSSNDGQIIVQSALAGVGIVVQPTYIVHDLLQAGKLVRVLDDWDLPRLTMNVAFPTRALLPARTRLFIDFLVERFRTRNYEELWTR